MMRPLFPALYPAQFLMAENTHGRKSTWNDHMSLETTRQNNEVRIRRYQTLLEISEAIASNRDLASLFHNLAQHLRAVVDFDAVSTLLYDSTCDVMRIHMLEPSQPGGLIGPAETPVDDVPSGWVW